ncbi:branched-chain amino acid ABC transporter permease [Variovorax sp. Sphag1AA]|uniref:branched-chain amino acid ABC transporter permease n=1 Tax=Variovorax sp. Sphag1AA TaxID=2587027 RepID=UPI00160863C7|nr:branched-chain amino acid ABC transporter permease [Variovorax sp. Sphag1AA]MBB3180581.1 branched-chain amino acid transport system permease protein [Variovorax sp. Sphag1AA]
MSELLQFLFSGLTVGAVYAVVAIGFTLIYAASDVVNFAQGEFVMLGGMATVFLAMLGLPIVLAAVLAVLLSVVVGVLLQKLAIERARDASPVTLIIITLGASIFIRGVAGLVFDKQFHGLPGISGSTPIAVLGATVLPQSLWVLASAIVMFTGLWLFLDKTVTGKALRASAANRLAAQLVGVNISFVLLLAFGLSAALGAIAGILVAPITLTRYDIGALLALKGFSAAIFGGLGNPVGAVIGGLALGLLEALAAGYATSVYKDGVAFVALILVLLVMPNGLMGSKLVDRV